ncbi:hypothetical protein [Bacillus toyonensis]|uniref:hypothetical protein n=1 Tax=Bacillus toyonensis TaxID=155322 RepID=UPI000BF3902D|nr:hypothetical protein [Bacillus toyonensis]PGF05295.1 hypothetical protein COM61_02475 [Bacillus toyonensis]
MKAKKLIALTLPVLLFTGCTMNTYGLTQAEFRKVDKEFKADKMIEDMKRLHYSDEQIETQLKGALSQLEYEEEQKKEDKSDKKEDNETNKEDNRTNKVIKDSVYVSATDYVDFMFRELINFKSHIRTITKESNALAEGGYEGSVKDTVRSLRKNLEDMEAVKIPKKYGDYEYKIRDANEALLKQMPELEKAIDKYEDASKDKKKVKEEVDKVLKEVDKAMYIWEPFFSDMDSMNPNSLRKAVEGK